jgi:alanine racemase
MLTRPCWVEITTRAFEDNYRLLANLAAPYAELLAIVKANAYGHSLDICAMAAVRAGTRWLGVTSVEEGVAARELCPDTRILVIGGIFSGQGADVLRHKLTPVVWEQYQLYELESAARAVNARSISIHLEIDTGMSRQGVDSDSLSQILTRFNRNSPLRLEAVMTHLFAADEADGHVTDTQLTCLDDVLARIEAAGIHAGLLNVGNTAALLAGQANIISTLGARYGMKTLMRPGFALYGLLPQYDPHFELKEPEPLAKARRHLQAVMSWKSQVVGVRSLAEGAVVGYNGTFVATEPMRVALIAAGYGDGLDRRLGNRFSLLVRGQRAPLVGRISMDQAVIDVTNIADVAAGDEVVILGSQGSETISAFDHAEATGTIPWEVFTRIAARVPRIVV